ncbi:MAG: coproporphyrinogen III oxidase [Gammaproteobacteria bacterium]|nr:coproporphyrinogen III oxidase [Gammaproteobacteria bacterium]
MTRTYATSPSADHALALVTALQQRFVTGLEALSCEGKQQTFNAVEWLREGGQFGGGERYESADGALFGRGSVNVSQIHYDDIPEKKLASATALSTIIHPQHPLAPSVHIHLSWTEMKDGHGYWRLMADLNPSNPIEADKTAFLAALKTAAPEQYDSALAQGDGYFEIPVLKRHRGVAHFYLENHNSGDATADLALAMRVGEAAIDGYLAILKPHFEHPMPASTEQKAAQLAYHSLYFFQVLTLDRGTTTGLLIHNQNDVGIMGSLPAYVDRQLLSSWLSRMTSPQDELLTGLIDVLPATKASLVDEAIKEKLAEVVRGHYKNHPEAIAMQAAGAVIPATVKNHG